MQDEEIPHTIMHVKGEGEGYYVPTIIKVAPYPLFHPIDSCSRKVVIVIRLIVLAYVEKDCRPLVSNITLTHSMVSYNIHAGTTLTLILPQ